MKFVSKLKLHHHAIKIKRSNLDLNKCNVFLIIVKLLIIIHLLTIYISIINFAYKKLLRSSTFNQRDGFNYFIRFQYLSPFLSSQNGV